MRSTRSSSGLKAALLTIITMILFATNTYAATEKVLHSFMYKDGRNPYGGLIFDATGNLYGTTAGGGAYRWGTVFELTPNAGGGGTEKVLHIFNYNGKDGVVPQAALIFDPSGNLYGTTEQGGVYNLGTVFKLTPIAGGGWAEKVLYSFGNGKDGSYPRAGLILDAAGNLFGTTALGGTNNDGTVFQLIPKAGGWAEKVLHIFNNNGKDGINPDAPLIFDAAGNLYGTTEQGGTYNAGTVFELTRTAGGGWTEKILHNFNNNGEDGYIPKTSLIFDVSGNLYGTTIAGGGYIGGTVFELSPTAAGGWTEKVLHRFSDKDGNYPTAGLIFDASGNLYGTTEQGGTGSCTDPTGSVVGCGTVFELTPTAGGTWTETVLHSFNYNGVDGISPFAGLVFDGAGNLYGTTLHGGAYGYGTVFEITP